MCVNMLVGPYLEWYSNSLDVLELRGALTVLQNTQISRVLFFTLFFSLLCNKHVFREGLEKREKEGT
jgi:hypothetical protein